MFSAIFTKEGNFCDFLFASLGNKAHPKRGLHLKEGDSFFPLQVDLCPIKKEG